MGAWLAGAGAGANQKAVDISAPDALWLSPAPDGFQGDSPAQSGIVYKT